MVVRVGLCCRWFQTTALHAVVLYLRKVFFVPGGYLFSNSSFILSYGRKSAHLHRDAVALYFSCSPRPSWCSCALLLCSTLAVVDVMFAISINLLNSSTQVVLHRFAHCTLFLLFVASAARGESRWTLLPLSLDRPCSVRYTVPLTTHLCQGAVQPIRQRVHSSGKASRCTVLPERSSQQLFYLLFSELWCLPSGYQRQVLLMLFFFVPGPLTYHYSFVLFYIARALFVTRDSRYFVSCGGLHIWHLLMKDYHGCRQR